MQSPPAEWAIFGLHFVALDYVRHRGEADFDTASEVIRGLVERTPHGRALLYVGAAVIAAAFVQHIDRPLRR